MTVNPPRSTTPATYLVGETLTLTCKTNEGYPKMTQGTPEVIWTRNDLPIENMTNHRINSKAEKSNKFIANMATSNLTLTVDRLMHNAVYKCGVKNHPNASTFFRSYSFHVLCKYSALLHYLGKNP